MGNGEKWWETVKNGEKLWETVRNGEKRWETVRNGEKRWETVRNSEKQWETVRNSEKRWETVRNGEKRWEAVRNDEEQWQIVKNSGFFSNSNTITTQEEIQIQNQRVKGPSFKNLILDWSGIAGKGSRSSYPLPGHLCACVKPPMKYVPSPGKGRAPCSVQTTNGKPHEAN